MLHSHCTCQLNPSYTQTHQAMIGQPAHLPSILGQVMTVQWLLPLFSACPRPGSQPKLVRSPNCQKHQQLGETSNEFMWIQLISYRTLANSVKWNLQSLLHNLCFNLSPSLWSHPALAVLVQPVFNRLPVRFLTSNHIDIKHYFDDFLWNICTFLLLWAINRLL